jgi:hypothetical protein
MTPLPLPTERPGWMLGSTQLPFSTDIASGERTAVDRDQHVSLRPPWSWRSQDGDAALCAPVKPVRSWSAVAVGKDRQFVVGSERALDGAKRVVDLGHDVGGQALVNDKGDGKRGGIDGEEPEGLAGVVLVDFEIAEGEAGDQFALGILDGDGNFNKVYIEVPPAPMLLNQASQVCLQKTVNSEQRTVNK